MTLEVRREWLWAAMGVILLGLLLGLGLTTSPRDAAGRPVLLMPDIRAVEGYRQKVVAWHTAWAAIGQDLGRLLSTRETSLLDQSRLAQRLLEQATTLAQAVEGTDAPGSLIGLHDQALAAAGAFSQASAAANRWLSAPTPANEEIAKSAYQAATAALTDLQSNTWLAEAGPGHNPATPTP